MEDLYNLSAYASVVKSFWGVDLSIPAFKSNAKWSDRVKNAFRKSGKQWNDKVEAEVKRRMAEAVAANPSTALNPAKKPAFDGLVTALHVRLDQI